MLCYGLLLVMWCDQPSPPVPSDSYCSVYKPVMWSSKDTRQTKEQVDRNNRVYKSVCR